jgi:hypothetical protein
MVGGRDLLEKLKNDSQLLENSSAKQGLEDMSLLFNYVDALEAASHVEPLHTQLTVDLIRSLPRQRIGLLHRYDL